MNQRAHFLIQILEKIGSPLMASIIEAHAKEPADASKQAAEMAALLTKSVQAGLALGNATELSDAQDDSLRVALTAIAGPLIANHYRQGGKAPADADIEKITSAMQAAMTFSENFTPAAENEARLRTLPADGTPTETLQTNLQFIYGFVPVIEAVSTFSFGQKEQKLIADVAARITSEAENIQKAALPQLSGAAQKAGNLSISSALAQIYAALHRAETARLSTMSEDEQTAQSSAAALENLWKNFDLQVSMLETLLITLLDGEAGAGTLQPDKPAKAEPPPAVERPEGGFNPMKGFVKPKDEPEEKSESKEAPSTPEEAPKEESSGQKQGSSENPMSFFANKKDDES